MPPFKEQHNQGASKEQTEWNGDQTKDENPPDEVFLKSDKRTVIGLQTGRIRRQGAEMQIDAGKDGSE